MKFRIPVFLPFKKFLNFFNRISRRVAPEVLEPRPVSSESITETMRRQTEPRPLRSESRTETIMLSRSVLCAPQGCGPHAALPSQSQQHLALSFLHGTGHTRACSFEASVPR